LELTQGGKQIIANLYANVFQVEHAEPLAFKKPKAQEFIKSPVNSNLNGDKNPDNLQAILSGDNKNFRDFTDLNL